MTTYKITSCGGNKNYADFVRVYAIDDTGKHKIAEVSPPCRRPLPYLRKWPNSKYTIELKRQLLQYGMASKEADLLIFGE